MAGTSVNVPLFAIILSGLLCRNDLKRATDPATDFKLKFVFAVRLMPGESETVFSSEKLFMNSPRGRRIASS